MRADELRASGALLGTELDGVTVLVRDVHRAVATRVFGLFGAAAVPARLMHDGIAAIAYSATRVGVRVVPPVVGAGIAASRDGATASAHDVPKQRFALGALNGFRGDRLAATRAHRPLATSMRVRTHDGPLRRITPNVAFDAREAATPKIVVFVHGLCETDLCWWFGAARHWGDAGATFGSKLRDDEGWTPLYVHYNSGLHVSANGRELSAQLESLVDRWPVRVDEIALVGHSMGGLVVRSAAHQANEARLRWVRSLTHVVGLGAPHLGAPLERLVSRGTHAMSRRPETKPFADWLNRRSVGIKDLRHGAFLEADWQGFDPDTCLDDRCTDAALLPGVLYSMASATLSARPDGVWAHDLLVQRASAHGVGPARSIPFDPQRTFHIGGKHHFDLLCDPLVYAKLREWLGQSAVTTSRVAGQTS
ncbi:MAG TPA: hypothetical protein VKQ07_03655 [Jatrophihabitantaceae bacterium]|nr:hypothetical protein [Jatrophihabitantaceae bacterium]